MSPERNAPCPCGSGKKFKRCCGETGAALPPGPLALNRAVAYRGEIGRRRERFCQEYTSYMRQQHAALAERLRRLAAEKGQVITCGRGCASCCHLAVLASVQECEAIVYHLYQHGEILRHFLASFDTWRHRIRHIWDVFQEIYRLQAKRLSSELSSSEEEAFGEALFAYRSENIPCPFLKEGACSIYEARPLLCAGVVATTPPEWCSFHHPAYVHSNYLTVEPDEGTSIPYFAAPGEKPCFSCMPVGVFEILHGGWGFLWGLPGCNWLENEFRQEAEIQSLLHTSGR